MNIPPKMFVLMIILVFGTGIIANNVIRGSEIPLEFSLLLLTSVAIFVTDIKQGLARFRSKIFLIISAISFALMIISLNGWL